MWQKKKTKSGIVAVAWGPAAFDAALAPLGVASEKTKAGPSRRPASRLAASYATPPPGRLTSESQLSYVGRCLQRDPAKASGVGASKHLTLADTMIQLAPMKASIFA
jgi:hypothetical protein